MQVAAQRVVTIAYELTDPDGDVLDSCDRDEPLSYLHGAGQLLTGLEEALIGREPGDKFSIDLSPEEGYGEYSEELVATLSREEFADVDEELEVGLELEVEIDDGPIIVRVVELTDDEVTIDGNHELAGLPLHFEVEVLEVRDATPSELDHGHVHDNGHDHH